MTWQRIMLAGVLLAASAVAQYHTNDLMIEPRLEQNTNLFIIATNTNWKPYPKMEDFPSSTGMPIRVARVEVVTKVETNWTDAPYTTTTLMFPPEANATTHHENGTVWSNTYLCVEWGNKWHEVRVESRAFEWLKRSYVKKVVREYSGP